MLIGEKELLPHWETEGLHPVTCGSSILVHYSHRLLDVFKIELLSTIWQKWHLFYSVEAFLAGPLKYVTLQEADLICGLVLSPAVLSEFLPWIIVGSLSLFSVLLCLFLPETLRQPLPDTIQQMGLVQWSVTLNSSLCVCVCVCVCVLRVFSTCMSNFLLTKLSTVSSV